MAAILIVAGCLAVTVSVPVVWLNRVVLDTDTYVSTVGPLSDDPAIQDAVATKVTDELFNRVRADDFARKVLPDQVDFLAVPILGATQGFVDEQVRKLLASPEFSSLWKEANRRAHDRVTQVLLGEGGTVTAEEGKLNLDLASLFDSVKQRLSDRGITIFDNISLSGADTTITLFQSDSITSVQSALNTLNRLATWLPVIGLVLLAGAVITSVSRWKAVFRIGLGIAAGMALLLVIIAFVRGRYLDALSASGAANVAAATSFFDIIISSLKTAIRESFVVGLIAAVVGFVFSPYNTAVRLRRNVISLYRTGRDTSAKVDLVPTENWILNHRALLWAAGIVLALLILVLMSQPGIGTAVLILVLLAIYLAAVELLARRAPTKPV